jgi:hypothetical protein
LKVHNDLLIQKRESVLSDVTAGGGATFHSLL